MLCQAQGQSELQHRILVVIVQLSGRKLLRKPVDMRQAGFTQNR